MEEETMPAAITPTLPTPLYRAECRGLMLILTLIVQGGLAAIDWEYWDIRRPWRRTGAAPGSGWPACLRQDMHLQDWD